VIPPISIDVLLALVGALRLDVTLLLIGGVLAVVGALLNLDARNKRTQAREADTRAGWRLAQADRLTAPIMAEAALYPTVPVESDEDADDAPAELGDSVEEQEPTRPLDYIGQRRRQRLTLRQRYERRASRRPFDDGEPVTATPLPVEVAPELPPVAAGAVEAEGLTETDAEFLARAGRELDSLFATIVEPGELAAPVGAR
jgi:hypothetical protein